MWWMDRVFYETSSSNPFEMFLLRFALYNGGILHVPRAAESWKICFLHLSSLEYIKKKQIFTVDSND